MTIRQLKKLLKCYPDDAHVVVGIVPTETLVVQKEGVKMEIEDGIFDERGCLNLMSSHTADQMNAAFLIEAKQEMSA